MNETKADQIKRLQGNLAEHSSLCDSDKLFFSSVPKSEIEVLHSDGEWHDKAGDCFCESDRHRIKSSYKPEPDTPVFPGYVLCETKWIDGDGWSYITEDAGHYCLSEAARKGCCGFVVKERLDRMLNVSAVWVDSDGDIYEAYEDGDMTVPATLGWVAFKKEEK